MDNWLNALQMAHEYWCFFYLFKLLKKKNKKLNDFLVLNNKFNFNLNFKQDFILKASF